MDQQKCYVYRQPRDRSAKRQKVEPTGLESSLDLRKAKYREAWSRLDREFDLAAETLNAPVLSRLYEFIDGPRSEPGDLRAGILLSSPGADSTSSLLTRIQEIRGQKDDESFVLLSASECPNLKTLLKALIRSATSTSEGIDDEDEAEEPATSHAKPQSTTARKLLNYDLEILHNWCKDRGDRQVLVAFRDGDAFDANVLAEAITLLNSWLDRISFKCLFGISTSVDIFQDRLPRSVLRCLSGSLFPVPQDSQVIEELFETITSSETTEVRFGAALSDALLQRQQDHMQSREDLRQQIKYAYMSHFFANPLSVFLSDQLQVDSLHADHYEAMRSLPSFQRLAQDLLKSGDTSKVRALLESDQALHDLIAEQLNFSQRKIVWTAGACSVIKQIRTRLKSKTPSSFASIYSRALAGTLKQSAALREMLLLVKTVQPDDLRLILQDMVDKLIVMPPSAVDISPDDFDDILGDLEHLIAEHPDEPLTSAGNGQATPASRNKRQQKSTEAQSQYAELVARFTSQLQAYLQAAVYRAEDLPLHEILIYDLKSPHRDVFTPKPRAAIERALSTPSDYLGRDSCGHSQDGPVSSQPATAVLYQLYMESGALINAFDLWTAFNSVMGEKQADERETMSLFFRALAELKYLSFVKQSRKRTDHLAKLAWKGL